MIRLRQLSGTDAGRVVDLDGALVRVGRMPDSEFALHAHADLEVSARHAVLEHDGLEWSITDVGSKNGTWVNGRRVVRWVVSDGDEITLGARGPRIRIELDITAARALELADTIMADRLPERTRSNAITSELRDVPPPTLPPPAENDVEVAEILEDLDEERTKPRAVPPTVKTPLERDSRTTQERRVRRVADASAFALVVVSLSVGFALGFGFAIAFVVSR